MRLGAHIVLPVPALPDADPAGRVGGEDVFAGVLDAGVQAVPSGIQGVERDELHRAAARPARDELPRERALAGAAAPVDQHHRGGRAQGADVREDQLGGRVQGRGDAVDATSA